MEGSAIMSRTYDHKKIAKFRRAKKITQAKLAERSGIPLDTIRDYEQGRSTPSVVRLFLIADVLGRSTDEFTTDVNGEKIDES